jgi:hypothetical protein
VLELNQNKWYKRIYSFLSTIFWYSTHINMILVMAIQYHSHLYLLYKDHINNIRSYFKNKIHINNIRSYK